MLNVVLGALLALVANFLFRVWQYRRDYWSRSLETLAAGISNLAADAVDALTTPVNETKGDERTPKVIKVQARAASLAALWVVIRDHMPEEHKASVTEGFAKFNRHFDVMDHLLPPIPPQGLEPEPLSTAPVIHAMPDQQAARDISRAASELLAAIHDCHAKFSLIVR